MAPDRGDGACDASVGSPRPAGTNQNGSGFGLWREVSVIYDETEARATNFSSRRSARTPRRMGTSRNRQDFVGATRLAGEAGRNPGALKARRSAAIMRASLEPP